MEPIFILPQFIQDEVPPINMMEFDIVKSRPQTETIKTVTDWSLMRIEMVEEPVQPEAFIYRGSRELEL